MSTQEKQAWFALCILAATTVAYFGLYAISRSHLAASSAFALTALLAAQGLIDSRRRKNGEVVSDERDSQISCVALVTSYSIFWVAFVTATVVPLFVMGAEATMQIRTADLASIVWPAMCLVVFIRSLAVVILHRRDQFA